MRSHTYGNISNETKTGGSSCILAITWFEEGKSGLGWFMHVTDSLQCDSAAWLVTCHWTLPLAPSPLMPLYSCCMFLTSCHIFILASVLQLGSSSMGWHEGQLGQCHKALEDERCIKPNPESILVKCPHNCSWSCTWCINPFRLGGQLWDAGPSRRKCPSASQVSLAHWWHHKITVT